MYCAALEQSHLISLTAPVTMELWPTVEGEGITELLLPMVLIASEPTGSHAKAACYLTIMFLLIERCSVWAADRAELVPC